MKQKLILVIAILAGLVAFGLTVRYLRLQREKILGKAKKIEVVVAAQELPAGSILKKSDLAKYKVFQRNVGARAILPESVRDIVGKRLLFSINRGDPIQWGVSALNGLLGGVYYPVAILPPVLAGLARLLPITYSLHAMRLALLQGASWNELALDILALVIFSVILVPLSLVAFRYAVHRAKVEGSLTHY